MGMGSNLRRVVPLLEEGLIVCPACLCYLPTRKCTSYKGRKGFHYLSLLFLLPGLPSSSFIPVKSRCSKEKEDWGCCKLIDSPDLSSQVRLIGMELLGERETD